MNCKNCVFYKLSRNAWNQKRCLTINRLFSDMEEKARCSAFVTMHYENPKFTAEDKQYEVEQFIKFWMPRIDFVTTYTRKQLAEILRLLYPWKKPVSEFAQPPFSDMCKRRMVKHIENYMNLHFKKEWR